ncbi:hypothetical protein CAEBREN_22462 [Caenorhabditis brenneri]|uniref:C-type lectin domain-containing protein n=1 Tax=Caenorhabditis brenneri TaxID=135651 RepID=G0NSP5_CAEBE|nr:hypothetical protein CAEBREN_22462 [Caenorhabditis brenneri]
MRLLVVLCSFLLITLVYSEEESEEEPIVIPEKIVKIRGTMNISDKFDRIAKYDFDETMCWKNPFCMAFYCLSPGKCRKFDHDTQVHATMNEPKDGEESYYGIRAILPNNECPSSYKDIVDFKYQAPDMLINSWRKVSGVWKFESCKEEWRRFERTTGKIVCLKGIKLDAGFSKEQAKSECATLGGVLTGVASIEESDWMQDQVSDITDSANNDYVFWIAGKRLNTCTLGASWTYRTNLEWEDGIMGNGDKDAMTEKNCDISCVSSEGADELCWGIMNYKRDIDMTIADVPCGGSSYMQGAFCAYELYK